MLFIALSGALLAAPCPAHEAIEGEPAIVSQLSALLDESQVRSSCPIVAVRIAREDAGYRIEIEDRWGRRAERSGKSLSTIAAFIAAWSEQEVVERAPVAEPASAPPPSSLRLLPIEVSATPPPAVAEKTVVLVSADMELGVGNGVDGPRPTGRVGVCARVGWACIGSSVRYGRVAGDHYVDVLADATAPIALGRVTIEPAVRFGAGYAEPAAFSSLLILWTRDWTFGHHLGLRLEGALTASIRLLGPVHFQLGGSVALLVTAYNGLDAEGIMVRGNVGILFGVP